MQLTAVITARAPALPLRLAVMRAAARRAALPFILSRLGLIALTCVANGGQFALIRWWFWDGEFYATIARIGYASPGWHAWFPLLPLAERAVSLLVRGDTFVSGLLIANCCTFAACVALEVLAPVQPRRMPVSALLLASPVAFFLAAPYTEPMFLLLAVGAFLALRRERFGWAIACCALATAARPTGIALLAPLVHTYLRTHGRSRRHAAMLVALVPSACSGLIAYMAYCLATTGDALAFVHVEPVYHGRTLLFPWQTAGLVGRALLVHPTLQLAANVLLMAITLGVFLIGARRLPIAQALFATGVILPAVLAPIPGSLDPLASGGRYMLAAFPAFLLLHRAAAHRPRIGLACLVTSVLAQAALALFELHGGWLP